MHLIDEKTGIYLRKMQPEDTDNIIKWRNSESVRKNFIYQELFTRQSHENWIKTKVETGEVVQFIICITSGDMPVGSVYLRDIDMHHRKAEYGIFIGEDSARGHGIGTASCKLALKYAFEELGLNRVYLRALAGNEAAIRSYEKAGFVKEGLLREDVCINGKFTDIVWMAVLNKKEV